ncbi:MAG TPA: MFS transporter [Dehalococcoidia bacterium]|nr:MFS transporter [Dehalococcoidia bacterium]
MVDDVIAQPTVAERPRATRLPATFASLRYRDYRFLWLGQLGHSASLWMEQIVRPVLILQLTDSALMVGLVVAARMTPMLLFGLLAGVAADRFDRKRILLTTQFVTMSVHFLMAFLVLTGLIAPWHVFVTTFVSGTSMAFNQPARQSLIPKLVPKEALLNAVALNTTGLNTMRVLGPSVAGVLLLSGIGPVYLLNGALIAGVMATTLAMRVPYERRAPGAETSWLADLRESFAFVGRHPAVLSVVGPALILFVFGFPYQSVFVPLFAKKVLDLGDSGVGALVACTGAGAVIGSLVMASQHDLRRRGVLLLAFLALFSGGLLVFSRSSALGVSILSLMAAASMSTSYMALTNSLLLELSPPELHGRVMSLMSLDRGLVPLGATIAGALASALGPQDGLTVMALVCLGLTALTAAGAPALRRL